MNNTEPTLTDLENQEPTVQEEIKLELTYLNEELSEVRVMLTFLKNKEKTLMARRAELRRQNKPDFLDEIIAERTAKNPDFPRLVNEAAGITEPIDPDGTPEDA